MDKLKGFIREIGPGGWLLPVAVVVCFVATIGGLFLQPPASPDVRFGLFRFRCWVDPCFLTRKPRWEHPPLQLKPFAFPAAVAVGPDGVIVAADNLGMVNVATLTDGEWQSRTLQLEPLDPPVAVAVGPDGMIVAADNLGMVNVATLTDGEWQLPTLQLEPLGPPAAVAVGPDGMIVAADNLGMVNVATLTDGEWQSRTLQLEPLDPPVAVAVGPDRMIVVLHASGTINAATLTDGEWQSRTLQLEPLGPPAAVAVGPDRAIVVLDEFLLLHLSTPPYTDWKILQPEFVYFDRPATAGVGPNRTIVVVDSMAMVNVATSLLWIPPNWSWIPLVLAIVGLVSCVRSFTVAWHRVPEPGNSVPAIESDRPLEDSEQATTAMRRVADRIVRFVRHPDASVPLTIAITGKWGAGKSSLMNLVKQGLYDDNCPCVFFNAWHHQNETHLFASLMESIRRSAVPRSFFARLEFRINLVRVRWKKAERLIVFLQFVFLLLAIPLPPLFRSRWNPMKAFGVTPASLIRSSTAWIQFPRFRDRLSFRHQFARAFEDVCKAFANHRLVILIDDLDRCRPEQVVQILEAVSFLTSNGECYILLGLDEDQVKRAVGLHYREISEEMAREHQRMDRTEADGDNRPTGEMSESSKYEARQAYADHYLEKLVNLKIKVPVPNCRDLHSLRGTGQS